ncbi:hypothetical protein [Winogradskyella sp. PE311]|uniref:hypothetical protein n=1 Tax=Winogradskyella sp. PE311 TaxID=3366943 RepID=UPI00397FBED5
MPLGAPHYHKYESVEDNFTVEVFCTPKHKTYHFFYDKNINIKECSKVFVSDRCSAFSLESFFDEQRYQKSININDRKFHKLFPIDTLTIYFSKSDKVISLLPVL